MSYLNLQMFWPRYIQYINVLTWMELLTWTQTKSMFIVATYWKGKITL